MARVLHKVKTMINFRIILFIPLFIGLNTGLLLAQGQPKPKMAIITLTNPSFEDVPRSGMKGGSPPSGWYDCGGVTETSPDIQPGFFGVVKPASNGSSYLGLVVRDNETYESVAQRLSQPLLAGKCYEWTVDLCRSEEYTSKTTTSGDKELSFSSAVQVRIWGGNGFCDRAELLYTTPYVVNTRWQNYYFNLKPKKANYTFIIIEAFFKTPMLFPYNGNVLVDNCSTIKQIDCADKKDEPVAVKTPPKRVDTTAKKVTTTTTTVTKAPPPVPKVEPVVIKNITEVDPAKLKKGDVLQIQNLYFDANQTDIKLECETTLLDVYNFLTKNPKVVVEVAGHTNNLPSDSYANKLSTNRAQSVAEWLVKKGIPDNRVQYKGYGKTMPIAPNTTDVGKKKNQRVEIRILSVNG